LALFAKQLNEALTVAILMKEIKFFGAANAPNKFYKIVVET